MSEKGADQILNIMRNPLCAAALLFALAACGGGEKPAVMDVPPAYVPDPAVRVVDGDTIDIDGQRYRLSGFDAPERHQKCRDLSDDEWACGRAATEELERLAAMGALTCSGSETDRYGRIVGSCSADGKDVGAALVTAGLAVNDPRYGPSYAAEEKEAKNQGRGIHDGRYLAPWDWRGGERLGDAAPGILVAGNTNIDPEELLPSEEHAGGIDLPALDIHPDANVHGAWVGRTAFYMLTGDDMVVGVSWAPHFPGTNPKRLDGGARWSGRMVGKDMLSGQAVNGSAVLELDGFSASRVDVSFTRIRGSGVVFEDMAWEDVPVVDGAFVSDNGSIEGRFYGDRHQEAGGVFERRSIIGAFGVSRD